MNDSLITTLDRRQSVSAPEVAAYTGWTLRVVQKYARLGVIPGAFKSTSERGRWRFKRNELEQWWKAQGN